MIKALLLLVLTCIPVILALLGYSGAADQAPANIGMVRALSLSPWQSALFGGLVSLILQHKRAIWWAMVVCFFYAYLNLGLIWGGFWSEGIFGQSLLNGGATFAAIGFIGALFTFGMVNVIRKSLENINQQQKR